MDSKTYDYIQNAASRYALEELIYLWLPTILLQEEGDSWKQAINACVPSLAAHYQIRVPEDCGFKAFLQEYYEQRLAREYQISLDDRLCKYAKKGDWRMVRFIMLKAKGDWGPGLVEEDVMMAGLMGAARGGHLDLVQFFVERGADDWDFAIEAAARGGDGKIIAFILEKSKGNFNPGCGLCGAARSGRLELVKFFLALPKARPHNSPILAAARGGHQNIVTLLMEQSGEIVNPSRCMEAAARGGHYKLVQFFASMVNNKREWRDEVDAAIDGNSKEILLFFLERDSSSTTLYSGLIQAIKRKRAHLVSFLLEKEICNRDYERAVVYAAEWSNWEIVEMLLERAPQFWSKALKRVTDLHKNDRKEELLAWKNSH